MAIPTFENGLARVGTGHKVHLITPNPTTLTVLCMPHSPDRLLMEARSTKVTCERCIRLKEAATRHGH